MGKYTNRPNRRQSRLGRGLSTLMSGPVQVSAEAAVTKDAATPGTDPPSVNPQDTGHSLKFIPLEAVIPNRNQPRKLFDAEALKGLADSIRSAGVMQPVTVRLASDGSKYELVAGERRWRAAKIAGFDKLPAIVRDLDDGEVAEWSLIENLQREDLNPIERAQAIGGLINRFGLSHEQVAERVGVERSTVSNALRLLTLDDEVQDMVSHDLLSVSQAKVLAGLTDLKEQRLLARQAVTRNWPVRRIEQAVRQIGAGPGVVTPANVKTRSSHIADLERQIGEQLGTKVTIKGGRKKGAGTLSIEFYSFEQFESLLERLGVETQ